MWSGGRRTSPLRPDELLAHWRQHGWPDDRETMDAECFESFVPADDSVDFGQSAGCRIWSLGASPHNIDPDTTRNPSQFRIIEVGLGNVLEHRAKKDQTDSGELMLLFEGAPLDSPSERQRLLGVVAGPCWKPKVFGFAMCVFHASTDQCAVPLMLPTLVRFRSRPCRAAGAFEVLDHCTGDELANVLTKDFHTVDVFIVEYKVNTSIDGSLLWSDITGLERVGRLYEPGLSSPLLQPSNRGRASSSAAACAQRMRSTDPLAARRSAPVTSGRPQRTRGSSASAGPCAGHGQVAPPPLCDAADAAGAGDTAGEPDTSERASVPPENELREDLVDMDLVDNCLDDSQSGSESDHDEAPLDDRAGMDGETPGDVAGGELLQPSRGVADEPLSQAVAEEFAGAAVAIGLAEDAAEADSDLAAGARSDGAPAEDSAEGAAQPWEQVSDPFPSGYCYLNGRSVLRIQRGRPASSCTITCYLRPSCNLLLTQARCPPDSELKK